MVIKKLLGHKILLALLIVYIITITWASLAKFIVPLSINMQGGDKIGHFVAYFIFTLVLFSFLFFSERRNENFRQSLIRSSIICFFYGGLMELLQMLLTNYRSPEWNDMLANTSGIIFAAIILKLFENKLIVFNKEKKPVT
ncbi:VanZ family protein [Aquimarina gracilis]|uniref:VanZ family protein n=1 Tax=Aquimarina gracilis TaxID=874422 RepID=A0ABU5ZRY1_9FLAO|nr:VanZ family protein [Aquimarina gracilis]MEB3344122.1 VanZ family protein [Aquimarina gracilis]